MKQTLKIILVSALVTAAAIKAVPALAEPATLQNVSVVQTADLDLSSKAGRTALDHRLVLAAQEVCGGAPDVDLAGRNDARQCVHDVLKQARAESWSLIAANDKDRAIRVAAR